MQTDEKVNGKSESKRLKQNDMSHDGGMSSMEDDDAKKIRSANTNNKIHPGGEPLNSGPLPNIAYNPLGALY